MKAPQQITPTKLADYLEVLTKPVFESGLNWQVVESKWPAFQEVFHGFDPETVATIPPDELDRMTEDTRIIRSRRKIEATMHNAREMLAIEKEFGSFKAYLGSQPDYVSLVKDMRKRFKFLGEFGAYYFLYVVGEPTPESHEYRAKLLEEAQKPR